VNSKPEFDFEQIEKYRLQIEYEEQQWQAFFDANQLQPMRLFYEDVCDEHIATVREICDWLGVNASLVPDQLPMTLVKQSDPLNEQWLLKYRNQRS